MIQRKEQSDFGDRQLESSAKKKFTRNKNTDIRDPSHNRYAMNTDFDLCSTSAILGDKK